MEAVSLMKSFGALGLVLGLIAISAFAARKYNGGGMGRRRDEKRLRVVESLTLDPRRRLLLVTCDSCEHLVLLGTNSELVLPARMDAIKKETINPSTNPAPSTPQSEPTPPAIWRSPSRASRRDEPTLGPIPPRGR